MVLKKKKNMYHSHIKIFYQLYSSNNLLPYFLDYKSMCTTDLIANLSKDLKSRHDCDRIVVV